MNDRIDWDTIKGISWIKNHPPTEFWFYLVMFIEYISIKMFIFIWNTKNYFSCSFITSSKMFHINSPWHDSKHRIQVVGKHDISSHISQDNIRDNSELLTGWGQKESLAATKNIKEINWKLGGNFKFCQLSILNLPIPVNIFKWSLAVNMIKKYAIMEHVLRTQN